MTKSEQERFYLISSTLQKREFYAIKDIVQSKAYLMSIALDSEPMASSRGDNAEDKNTGDVAHVATDEGESCHSRGDPSKGDHSWDDSVEYIGTITKGT